MYRQIANPETRTEKQKLEFSLLLAKRSHRSAQSLGQSTAMARTRKAIEKIETELKQYEPQTVELAPISPALNKWTNSNDLSEKNAGDIFVFTNKGTSILEFTFEADIRSWDTVGGSDEYGNQEILGKSKITISNMEVKLYGKPEEPLEITNEAEVKEYIADFFRL